MITIADRLQIIRGHRSRRSFADALSITEGTLRNYEQGLSLPNSDVLARICTANGINPDWLLLGNDPMLRSDTACAAPAGADEAVLFSVVETVEEVLNELDGELAPARKAELVCTFYKLFTSGDEAAKKPATILRLVKGALG